MKLKLTDRELNKLIKEEFEDLGDIDSLSNFDPNEYTKDDEEYEDSLDGDQFMKEKISKTVLEKMKDLRKALDEMFPADALGENRNFIKYSIEAATAYLFQ